MKVLYLDKLHLCISK